MRRHAVPILALAWSAGVALAQPAPGSIVDSVDAQPLIREDPQDDRQRREHRREDRTTDAEGWKIHEAGVSGGALREEILQD